MKDLLLVVRLVVIEKKDILYTILFGFLAGIVAISLFASSGYLISKAALVPPLYTMTVMLALLKLCSILRGPQPVCRAVFFTSGDFCHFRQFACCLF